MNAEGYPLYAKRAHKRPDYGPTAFRRTRSANISYRLADRSLADIPYTDSRNALLLLLPQIPRLAPEFVQIEPQQLKTGIKVESL